MQKNPKVESVFSVVKIFSLIYKNLLLFVLYSIDRAFSASALDDLGVKFSGFKTVPLEQRKNRNNMYGIRDVTGLYAICAVDGQI